MILRYITHVVAGMLNANIGPHIGSYSGLYVSDIAGTHNFLTASPLRKFASSAAVIDAEHVVPDCCFDM